jgi:Tfp pilus assembly protein FimT
MGGRGHKLEGPGLRAGFTLLEAVVVVGILAVLAFIIFPTMSRLRTDARVQTDARSLENSFQRARTMAAIVREPVRVVVDCAESRDDGCASVIQTPVFNGMIVKSWRSRLDLKRPLKSTSRVVKASQRAGHDGYRPVKDVFWVIFLPDGRVFSDPKPFEVMVRDRSGDASQPGGWRVSISADTGRVAAAREPL